MIGVMSPRPVIDAPLPHGTLDQQSGLPLYRQLAALLRQEIKRGTYPAGAQLPTEQALMDRFGVTRPTIRGAFSELRAEGLVVTSRGKGTYVRESPTMVRVGGPWRRTGEYPGKTATFEEMERAGHKPGVYYIGVGREKADDDVARWLNVPIGTPVAARRRVLLMDDQPVQVAASWVPWDIAKGTPLEGSECEPEGSYPHLEAAGHQIVMLEEELSARMPTPEERSLLLLPPGTPVLRMVRTALDADGRVVEVADTVNSGDRYRMVYPFPFRGRTAKLLSLRR
jgi:GntR family transcriptional regulator